MKNYILIIILISILSGCAKKLHTLDVTRASKQTRISRDSTGQKQSQIIDKTITIVNKQLDTSLRIAGNSLIGYIDLRASISTDTIVYSHFENSDLILDLHTNKKTGKTQAIATSKAQIISLKFREQTTIYNDIQKTEQLKSQVRLKTQIQTDSSANHKVKQSEPIASVGSLKTAIWFAIIIAIAGLAVYLFKRFAIN